MIYSEYFHPYHSSFIFCNDYLKIPIRFIFERSMALIYHQKYSYQEIFWEGIYCERKTLTIYKKLQKMKSKTILVLFGLICAGYLTTNAQGKKMEKPMGDTILLKGQKSVTHGTVTVEGNAINYQAVAGTIILKNEIDSPTIAMSYVAYFKEGEKDAVQRPITFLYNSGPGSSTIWLHMGAFGPQRVSLSDTAATRPPYTTVNNDYSLLDASDLVFIDAAGTGFSKIITKESGGAGRPEDFYGGDADANAFASFIVQFLTQYNRWASPKYLFGESYGTFRSALLADILETDKGVSLNGVILLSQTLNIANSPD